MPLRKKKNMWVRFGSSDGLVCTACPEDMYSVGYSNDACHAAGNLTGVTCNGGSNVYVSRDYYAYTQNTSILVKTDDNSGDGSDYTHYENQNQNSNENNLMLLDDNSDSENNQKKVIWFEKLEATLCPPMICCNNEQCNFFDKSELCATQRNASIPLCGACNQGYSETVGSYISHSFIFISFQSFCFLFSFFFICVFAVLF